MKSYTLVILIVLLSYSCRTTRYVPPLVTTTRSEYIATYSDIAIREMRRSGIPASIKMAQAILESGDGNSTLARRANNHFGIKCHDWTGRRIYHDDDKRNECFRRYSKPEESFRDHSDFITGRSRYAGLFDLDPNDYTAWAKGLKASGYATNPQYDRLLIKIIEENGLYKLDTGQTLSAPAVITAAENRNINKEPASAERKIMLRNRIKYIVASEGDTYESITREMGLMRWELARYNDIEDNATIDPGDIIYLQPKRSRAERGNETHIVKEGETMHSISQLYGVRLDRLLRRNSGLYGKQPSPGTTIFLR
ncbi:MAG: glucosaminidase domain-containing protein [Bacteroidales bacterium]